MLRTVRLLYIAQTAVTAHAITLDKTMEIGIPFFVGAAHPHRMAMLSLGKALPALLAI